jgi:two-component system, NtrC family, C4-dicarboxylate transport sensor histidine kinase DctB
MDGHEAHPTTGDLVTLNRAATVARLMAGVTHEVNNALHVISGSAELLEESPDAAEAVTKGASRIRSQTARAAGAIAEVLAFARDDPEHRGLINLRDLASRAVALRKFSVSRAGLTIAFEAAEEETFLVSGSRVLLQQAILNLIANAEQALAGQRGGAIIVTLAGDEAAITLRVSDNGPGVPADLRDQVFEPFVTTRPRHEFPGLGLTAARDIAQTHNGTLALEETASGASFALQLPAAR